MFPGFDRPDDTPGQTQSLYRKYRPATFNTDDLVGQEHISRTLRNAIARGRVAHAYLFCGPRGTGKTSTARLLAKAVNCLHPEPEQRPCNACTACVAINDGRATDIVEIDAASNRGIDDIRELRERVKYAPTQLRTKFYIIDEAHQITKEGFNAFLKTLEEPPPNTTFVLATTDPDRLPDTIASRCQRFDFRRIPVERIAERLRAVANREGFVFDDEALGIIARQATGSLRDALSMLDMLATSAGEFGEGVVDGALARRMLGLSQDGRAVELVRAIASRDIAGGLGIIGAAADAGQDMRSFARHIIELLRTLLLLKAGARPPEATDELAELSGAFSLPELLHVNRQFADVDFGVRNGGIPQLPLELAFVGSIIESGAAPIAAQAPVTIERVAPVRPPTTPAPPPRPSAAERRPDTAARRDEAPRQPAPAPRSEPATASANPALAEILAHWDRIRTEVKAVDRKAEALLASTDPYAFDGSLLTIVAAYPFHVGRLNDPRMRQIIEEAVARTMHVDVRVAVVLKSDVSVSAPPRNGAATANVVSESSARYAADDGEPLEPNPDDGPANDDEAIVRAAAAIFNATEID